MLQFSVFPGDSNSLLTLMGSQAVQGGAATVASYIDPAAPPGATINQLLPTSDPRVAKDQQQAYQALVQAAKDIVGPSESFTDFLNVNTGVTITPQHLFGLQDTAYNAVIQAPAKYLGTANPSPGLLAALQNVVGLLDRVDSMRQNVMSFLQVQDTGSRTRSITSWGRTRCRLSPRRSWTTSDRIIPSPILEPPPQTAYTIGAEWRSRGEKRPWAPSGRSSCRCCSRARRRRFGGLLFGLIKPRCHHRRDLRQRHPQQYRHQLPTLVVPPDKDQISTLIQAASTYQAQLIAGLNAQRTSPTIHSSSIPSSATWGCSERCQNLNPLVLDSKKADDQLGPNNPPPRP